MNTLHWIVSFVFTGLIGGLLGMAAMGFVMWLICRSGWAKGNMVVALGSLVTRNRETAWIAGAMLHTLSAVIFAFIYEFAMIQLHLSHMPRAFEVGIGFGVIHGMIVSLTLVWECAEQHPLPEFREAGLAVGVSHFAGHVAYGAVVGLAIGLLGPG
jgi:hypothetical protein